MIFNKSNDGLDFEKVDLESLPGGHPPEVMGVWRSSLYLVRHYSYKGMERLSIDYAISDLNDRVDTISWDVLQAAKNSVGFADRWAIELYPPQEDEDTTINCRHLWLTTDPGFSLRDED